MLGRAVEHAVVQRGGLVAHGVVLGHELVDVAPDRLLARPPEQPLGGRVPRGDEEVGVARNDRGRADLDQGLVEAALPVGVLSVDIDAKRRAPGGRDTVPGARRACLMRA